MCPLMQVDKGAITFVLSGANIMCPGLTSKGAIMTPGLNANDIVTVVAEGKQHALSIGVLKMSVDDMYVYIFYLRSNLMFIFNFLFQWKGKPWNCH